MHSHSASKKTSILGNVTWEGGCVIYLTQHNCLISKLPGKSWLVLMNSCIWFRGNIVYIKKETNKQTNERAQRPWKNRRALDKRSAIANILVGLLSCVSKGPLFALDAWALALMMKYWWLQEKLLAPPPHPWGIRFRSGHFTSYWCWGPDIKNS